MKVKKWLLAVGTVALSLTAHHGSALAADVLCLSTERNHMFMSDAYASACMAAGVGSIGQGNQSNDAFLQNMALDGSGLRGGYKTLGAVVTTNPTNPLGTFSFEASRWDSADELFIGFKFGTGNTPDEWMVFQLKSGVRSGTWRFVDVQANGNALNERLSGAYLYSRGDGIPDTPGGTPMPEPASLALVGVALLGLGAVRRRRAK